MLPKQVADDLRQGKPSQAQSYISATVFFRYLSFFFRHLSFFFRYLSVFFRPLGFFFRYLPVFFRYLSLFSGPELHKCHCLL